MSQYVYLVKMVQDTAWCKVGITENIKSRLTSMQNANPHELELVRMIVVLDQYHAEYIEYLMYRKYYKHASECSKEWYNNFHQINREFDLIEENLRRWIKSVEVEQVSMDNLSIQLSRAKRKRTMANNRILKLNNLKQYAGEVSLLWETG